MPSAVRLLPCGSAGDVRGLGDPSTAGWSFSCDFEPSRPASGLPVEGGLEAELLCGPLLAESGTALVELAPPVDSIAEFLVPADAVRVSVCGVAESCVPPALGPRPSIPATFGRAPGGRAPS